MSQVWLKTVPSSTSLREIVSSHCVTLTSEILYQIKSHLKVLLFAQRPERQVKSTMVAHCTSSHTQKNKKSKKIKKRGKITNMPCRRTCRSHSRLFVKQRPQNSQGRRLSAPLGPELLLVLLVGDARTSGK